MKTTALTTTPTAKSLATRKESQALIVPTIIANQGTKTTKRFLEFFTANNETQTLGFLMREPSASL